MFNTVCPDFGNLKLNWVFLAFKNFLFYLLIYACAGPSVLHGLSLVEVHWLLVVVASLVAELSPWEVGSFQTRDRTTVPCIARWILNHWTTREAPNLYF